MTARARQVSGRRDQEDDDVAAGGLEDIAGQLGDEHATHRSRHPAESNDGADSLPRKRVGYEREEIRRPTLVRRGRQSDEANGHPEVVGR